MLTIENKKAFQSNANYPLANSMCYIVIKCELVWGGAALYSEVQIEQVWTSHGGTLYRSLGSCTCTPVNRLTDRKTWLKTLPSSNWRKETIAGVLYMFVKTTSKFSSLGGCFSNFKLYFYKYKNELLFVLMFSDGVLTKSLSLLLSYLCTHRALVLHIHNVCLECTHLGSPNWTCESVIFLTILYFSLERKSNVTIDHSNQLPPFYHNSSKPLLAFLFFLPKYLFAWDQPHSFVVLYSPGPKFLKCLHNWQALNVVK